MIAALLIGASTFAGALLALRAPRRAWTLDRVQPHLPVHEERLTPKPSSGVSSVARLAMETLLRRLALEGALRGELERAGSSATPEALAWASLLVAIAVTALGYALTGAISAALLAGLAAAAAPHLVLAMRRRRRARAFDEQLPDVLDLIAASLKVGHSFDQALRAVASDAGEPAASEIGRALGEIRLGCPSSEALGAVGARLDSSDLPFVLTAVEIQQQVGGSLAGLLSVVAGTVRERQHFRRKVKGLTAMGRASAMALIALPFAAAAGLSLIRPGYMQPFWESGIGRALAIGAVVSMLIGSLILRRIVSVRT